MTPQRIYPLLGLVLFANHSVAAVVPMSITPMPLEMGGVAAVAGLSLIIAAQLIKRRN